MITRLDIAVSVVVALFSTLIAVVFLFWYLKSLRGEKLVHLPVSEEAGAAGDVNSRLHNATDLKSVIDEIAGRVDGEGVASGRASARTPASSAYHRELRVLRHVNSGLNDPTDEIGYKVDGEAVASGRGPTSISYLTLVAATNEFSNDAVLGQGKFGFVYRAILHNPHRDCAVKKLTSHFQQSRKDVVAVLQTMGDLDHKNVVKLHGWCLRSKELFLVYEYIPNFSLEEHLFGGGEKKLPPLSWKNRYKIACGLAAGVGYLHTARGNNNIVVIHRDIKPANILLDEYFTPKLGDFGLATLIEDGKSMNPTANSGTFGYIAPEIAFSGAMATKESDVFSVGVVALQIATGKGIKIEGFPVGLVSWVWTLLMTNVDIVELLDDKLSTDQFNKIEAIRLLVVGLWCCHSEPSGRPQINEVISVLNFSTQLRNVPFKPPEGIYAMKDCTSSHIKERIKALLNSEAAASSANLLATPPQRNEYYRYSGESSSSNEYYTPRSSSNIEYYHTQANPEYGIDKPQLDVQLKLPPPTSPEPMDERLLQQIPEEPDVDFYYSS